MSELLNLDLVRFAWEAKTDVLNIPSFSISNGQHTFIMGPSGCGKSTLLNLIGGVVVPQHGKVILNGVNTTQLRPSHRDRIRADTTGFIFQQFNLVPYLSAYENVLLPCQFSQARAENAIDQAGSAKRAADQLLLGFFADNVPDFNRPVAKLSVGQQQRVAAARALIGNPALIIADEPTSALDQDNRLRFMSLLLREADRRGSTLLFVSHDPTLADQFPKVCNMRQINQVPMR
ncbi:MAG: ATP-binding cassette domain-containing protein [Gammaproteobacteria bacterium]|nr:ATP-binding cassette domain-containing protein [Gammaproteobacteria bacterium]